LGETSIFRRNISPPSSGLKNKPRKTQEEAGCKPYVCRKPRAFSELHRGGTTQQTVLFIVITVGTSNPNTREDNRMYMGKNGV
jgi:hypothetical protein